MTKAENMTQTETFTIGQLVKYSNPVDQDEANARFAVLEDRDGRLLVQFVCDWFLKPTNCFASTEFTAA